MTISKNTWGDCRIKIQTLNLFLQEIMVVIQALNQIIWLHMFWQLKCVKVFSKIFNFLASIWNHLLMRGYNATCHM